MFGFAHTLRFPSLPLPLLPHLSKPQQVEAARATAPSPRLSRTTDGEIGAPYQVPRMMSDHVVSRSPEDGRGGVWLSQDNCKTWSECVLVNTVKLSHAAGKFAAESSRFIPRLFWTVSNHLFCLLLSGIALTSLIFLDIIIYLSTLNFKNPTDDIPANGVPQSKEHEFLFRQVMRKSQHVSDKKERTVNALHERTTAFHTCILSREPGTSGHGFRLPAVRIWYRWTTKHKDIVPQTKLWMAHHPASWNFPFFVILACAAPNASRDRQPFIKVDLSRTRQSVETVLYLFER